MLRVLSPEIRAGRQELEGAQGCGRPLGSPRRDWRDLGCCAASSESCRAVMLLFGAALSNMVLITCSLSFYKLQIRINCFMASL